MFVLGDRTALRPVRLAGIAVGLGGVALLVGGDLRSANGIPWLSVGQVMLVCVCYAVGPFIVARRLGDVPSLGVIAVRAGRGRARVGAARMGDTPEHTAARERMVGDPRSRHHLHRHRVLGVLRADRRDRARGSTLITFANPAVAVVLGAVFLDEAITGATIGGFVLVLGGCWLATRSGVVREDVVETRDVP